jgi:signal transduction histidine kinase
MVDEVLDVARIEARALPLTLVDVDLEPVVLGVLAMVQPLADAEQVSLHMSSTADAVLVHADERRVRQVLLNLVTNAIRYNRANGTVHVGWCVADGAVRITVRDSGAGIPAEHLGRLFTPFDRLGRDSEEGVGLGLPLARGLTEAMGGTLDVDSRVPLGTTVSMVLPVAAPPVRSG